MPTSWPKSAREFERACQSIPGGVNSPARAFGGVGGHPILIASAQGSTLTDIDGNHYIDYVGSWGPMILGHRHPSVVAAIECALTSGTSFGAPTTHETELAELIKELVPGIEKARMVSSGTEASMSAIRLARGFTGRDVIVKFAGCYHGHVDSLLVQAGSAATTLGVPSSPGVPIGCTKDTLVLPFNDADQVAKAFQEHGGSIAGIIVEPVPANMGVVPPRPGYLQALREITTKHGALLIFDEVITGFRLGLGGAQAMYGVKPDLTVLGKIIGGGLPVGAYGGRADVMEAVSPAGPVFQAGTLSGNPLAMAAGLATLRTLRDTPPYPDLERKAALFEEGLRKAAATARLPHSVIRVGNLLTLFFNGEPVVDYATATRSDTRRFALFFWRMMEQGIYLPCSQYEALFLSTAHTEEQIRQTIDAAGQALERIAKA